ncbi:MAG: radical SAM protein [Gemmatimonadota bacterium]|nr:radical SAM protein [Gemmatimonadota bacterium]
MSFRDRVVSGAANVAWNVFQSVNTRLPEGQPFQPEWASAPLLKSYQRSMPTLGFPRETDSLCPDCVKEVRTAIIEGTRDIGELVHGNPGEIKAQILEENGCILMRKTCSVHGPYEDVLSIDPEFTRIIENRFPGRDYSTWGDEHIHRHGTSSIKYGRGAVLTIDLTNRCNMMCNPCFMDANQVGYVHELTMDDVKRILDASISFKPRRQMSVQFSGGEPTISPHFLDACRYAKEVGYWCVQAATNGLRFAKEPDFAFEAKAAGFDMAYLQFDGVTNEANQHRHISNLFDAKLLAMENLSRAGVDITPVTTVLNSINNDQVGPILQFCIDNSDKVGSISFQPVSFTGRDEDISDEMRHRQRYTISHLAHDLQSWSGGKIDAHRDWYPLGSGTLFTTLADHLRGQDVEFGGQTCSCHPNCGSAVHIVVNEKTRQWASITQFFNQEQFMKDIEVMTDTARDPGWIKMQVGMSLLRNFNPRKAPAGFGIQDLARILDRRVGGSISGGPRPDDRQWRIMWVGGMWFQDLWTYDFRRTEMCVIPYGTQEGEISFCAYNTGVGWRQIIENMHMTASTADWFKTRGRHPIFAGNRDMPLPGAEHTLRVRETEDGELELPVIDGNHDGNGCCGSEEDAIRKIIAAPDTREPVSS